MASLDDALMEHRALSEVKPPKLKILKIERIFPIRIDSFGPQRPARGQITDESSRSALSSEIDTKAAHSSAKDSIDLNASHFSPNLTINVRPETSPKPDASGFTPLISVKNPPVLSSSNVSNLPYFSETFVPISPHDEEGESMANQTVYRCEDEPIHIPGAVQKYGALIALRDESGIFVVRIVSENTQSIVGHDPTKLFELRCFTDLLIKADRTDFLTRVRAVFSRWQRFGPGIPDVFTISLTSRTGAPTSLYCAIHLELESGLIICEFEREKDVFNSGSSPAGIPEQPISIMAHRATELEQQQSTTSRSEPIHALRVARELLQPLTPMNLFNLQAEIQGQLSRCTEVSNLLDVVVGLVHDLTGFHRVMLYQFDATAAGCVVSEIVDPRASTDIYRGLHFPAADIPQQARSLYMKNTVRVLYDRSQETSRLICRTIEDAKVPINLQHSYLRAMSPIHLRYLANMGVQASMSISIIVNEKLWGLVACHNYGANGAMRMSLPLREVCRGIGYVASDNVEKLLLAARIRARSALFSPATTEQPLKYIASSTSELLSMFNADFGFLVIRNEARTLGKLLAYNESVNLLGYIRQRAYTQLFCTSAIQNDCPDLGQHLFIISGMLVIPLATSGSDFLVFLRKGQVKEINWAGNPNEKKTINQEGTYLEPRSSFQRWIENVAGTSREWTENEVESASMLATLYGRFIEIWKQKEAIVQQNRMTRLLIRNAGHEVRTPLNSVINYLEVALEETLDEKARLHLTKSLQASKSLTSMVNNLLNLTEAEDAGLYTHEDNVDVNAIITETVDAFKEEALSKNLLVHIAIDHRVPTVIKSDPSGLRQVVSNLLANAIQYSASGDVRIEVEHLKTTDTESSIRITVIDNGIGLTEDQLDSIFSDFEQIMDDDDLLEEDKGVKSLKAAGVNLGLASTARFVRILSGEIKMSSSLGEGTAVSITLPYKTADDKYLPGMRRSRRAQTVTTPDQLPYIPALSSSSSLDSVALASATTVEALTSPLTTPDPGAGRFPFPTIPPVNQQISLQILVAEDNPLNSRLLETRLRRSGHHVLIAVNGNTCFNAFERAPDMFDIILMDIQMPLLSGIEATKKIRSYEKGVDSSLVLSKSATRYGRIPIIAVSASLSEQSVDEYIEDGFDGWILKPIDFKELEAIIAAVEDRKMREVLLYSPGGWDNGGWFRSHGSETGDS